MKQQFPKLNRRFPRRRAFITGAGSGLGLAFARALAGDGWSLGLFDRDLERLAAVEADLSASGIRVLAYPGDVTQPDELTVAVNSFAAANDGLDVMINNAGVAGGGGLMEVSPEDLRSILDINFMGVVHGARAAIPHLQRNGTGLLLNVASAAAFTSTPGMVSYNASKAAVLSLSETLAGELRPAGTQVSVAMPACFESNLLETSRGLAAIREQVAQRMAGPEWDAPGLAREVLRRAGAGRTYIVLPACARLMWLLKRWMPRLFLTHICSPRKYASGVGADALQGASTDSRNLV